MTYFIQFDTKMENKCESSLDIGDEMIEPHESLFLVLAYLNLFELLTITKVCKSLRDAVHNDVLLWLDIIVEPPLNSRITDYNLREVTSKAQGRLRTLGLLNCVRVTDDGLQRVVDDNPHISKLYVPACTGMTPNGLVTIITRLTERSNDLKFLRLRNCHNMTKEHLETLTSCLKLNPVQQEQQCQPNMFLQNRLFSPMKKLDTNRPIDVEVCPKCNEVQLVFDCPRESCREKRRRPLSECRGCYICIPRCEGCGGCVNSEDLVETTCLDVLCLDCWLQLPKCNMCNKPYCPRHAHQNGSEAQSSGFVCDVCLLETQTGKVFRSWKNYD